MMATVVVVDVVVVSVLEAFDFRAASASAKT